MQLDIFSKEKEENKKEEQNKLRIIADIHEKNSLVGSELVSLGVNLEYQHLKVADFIIGNVAIERKTVSDFISSMINKRLIWQLEEMKQYEKKLLIIEGIEEQELYNDSPEGINGNAIRGMLLYISLEAATPIIFTKDYEDTARFLFLIAKRQEKSPSPLSLHAKKKSFDRQEQKQYILEAFPGIGPSTAKKLLEKFKTISNTLNASEDELKEILKSKTEPFKSLVDN
jgi:ERCC4-type nuclease